MATPRRFKVGDRVRVKNSCFDCDKGIFKVRSLTAQIGYPVWIENLETGYRPICAYPADLLELVTPTDETDDQRKFRELEERVQAIERQLGIRL